MQTNSFNLIELYTKVFGIKGVRFAIPAESESGGYGNTIDYNTSIVTLPRSTSPLSILGTPIYEQIQLISRGKEYLFPDWPLIDISAHKIIVKTAIKTKPGTVKEFISMDDYQVNIRGILVNYNSEDYPYDLVKDLHEVFKIDEELQVVSPVLNLLDIHSLVIEDIRLPEVEGYNNIQPFVLQCLSDRTVELVIRDAKKQVRNIIQGL